ncbi:hypothetical protein ACXET9_04290 [Brachybacterium sp. DNPG3]
MLQSHRIIPFEGVDDVRFGMSPAQVAAVAGPPDRSSHDRILEITTEVRGATEYEFDDESGALTAIYVFKPGRGRAVTERLGGAAYVPVFHDGIEILSTAGFDELFARERSVEGRGGKGVLLPDIGVLIAGFRKRVPDGRYAIVLPRDQIEGFAMDWLDV